MIHRGLRQDAVAKIENMRPSPQRRKNIANPSFQRGAPSGERQGIEITLQHKISLEFPPGPFWINCAVEPERVDAGSHRVILQMQRDAFGKADDASPLVTAPQTADDRRDWRSAPTFKFGCGQDTGPSVEDLHGFDTRFDLSGKVVDRGIYQPVDEMLKLIGISVGEQPGRSLIGRAFASDHIAGQRPRRAAEANERGFLGRGSV